MDNTNTEREQKSEDLNVLHFLWRKIFRRPSPFTLFGGRDVIKIKCVNKNCTSPDGTFEFDEALFGATGPSTKDDPTSQPFVIECHYCHMKNLVWLKRPGYIRSVSLQADMILVKDEPLDFR